MKTKNKPAFYRIRVDGHLGSSAAVWFPEMQIQLEKNGQSTLCGLINDQAELHGLLIRIRDLGLTLTLVQRMEDEDKAGSNKRDLQEKE